MKIECIKCTPMTFVRNYTSGLALALFALAAFFTSACDRSSVVKDTSANENTKEFTQDQYLRALRSVALRTSLSIPAQTDVNDLSKQTEALRTTYEGIVDKYVDSQSLSASLLDYFRVMFGMGASENEPLNDDPAKLAVYVVLNDLPWSELILADYKIDANGVKVSGQGGTAPAFELAGFMTLPAWTKFYAGNGFLFDYVREVASITSCYRYPDPDASLFSWDEANIAVKYQPQSDINCHSCHKTMNVRRSVWYKWDRNGTYQANQGSGNVFGHEPNVTPPIAEPRAGAPFKFLDAITTPKSYAQQIVTTDRFNRCAARRFLAWTLGYETDVAGSNGKLMYDFDASANVSDKALLDKWSKKMKETHQLKIKSFLKEFFKSDDFISRIVGL